MSGERVSKSSLPFAVMLFFNNKFTYIYFLIEFVLFIYKGVRYEYPEQVREPTKTRYWINESVLQCDIYDVGVRLGNGLHSIVPSNWSAENLNCDERCASGTRNTNYYLNHYGCNSHGASYLLHPTANVRLWLLFDCGVVCWYSLCLRLSSYVLMIEIVLNGLALLFILLCIIFGIVSIVSFSKRSVWRGHVTITEQTAGDGCFIVSL